MSERTPREVSWVLATWTAPLVPGLSLGFLALLGASTGLADAGQDGGYAAGLGVGLGVLAVGAGLLSTRARLARGAGVGLVVGATVTSLGWLAVLVT